MAGKVLSRDAMGMLTSIRWRGDVTLRRALAERGDMGEL
jgi:hypothetical protein